MAPSHPSSVPSSQREKTCHRCGRPFRWRKKWARDWDAVRFCSERCRRARLTSLDRALERAVVELLAVRHPDKSICPSEAARAVDADWRPLMDRVRHVAAGLLGSGAIRVTQGPRDVHPLDARGPIRLRRGPRFPEPT